MDPKELKRVRLIKRIAQELPDGALVNLGIGMPTMVADHIPAGRTILLHSENGFIGLGRSPEPGKEDPRIVNAGGQPVTLVPGGCYFDSAMSFAIIRGGHVDYTVLGALEVDMEGNLANYMIPGKMVPGMGGAPKILKKCTLPLTAVGEVDIIVTDMAFIRVTKKGLVLEEVAEGTTVEEVVKATEAPLHVPGTVRTF
jgi:acetate CoA/acetoacetate CoA-transferase beta subunit